MIIVLLLILAGSTWFFVHTMRRLSAQVREFRLQGRRLKEAKRTRDR